MTYLMNQYLASLSEARELQRQRVFSHRPDPRDIPIRDSLLIHDKILLEVYVWEPIPEEQLLKRFDHIGDAAKKIVDREVNDGYLKRYEEGEKIMIEITGGGKEHLRFGLDTALGWGNAMRKYPELYGMGKIKVNPDAFRSLPYETR